VDSDKRLGVDDVVTWIRVHIYERSVRWLSSVERDLSIYPTSNYFTIVWVC